MLGQVSELLSVSNHMNVFKFGGTSLGDANKILHVAQLVKSHANNSKVIVVVSAMAGVTDKLIDIVSLHTSGQTTQRDSQVREFITFHKQTLRDLQLDIDLYDQAEPVLENMVMAFKKEIHRMKQTLHAYEYDFIVSYGERLSAFLVSKALQNLNVKSHHIFGSDVIFASADFGNATALLPESKRKCENVLVPLLKRGEVPVVTGFFGATECGHIAIFGRGGSDYSAAVIAALMKADSLTVWKEVDGVFTSDPLKNADAQLLEYLSYEAAAAMARAGAKVLHPETMEPVRDLQIPVHVRNTFNPELPGTKIHN